MSLFHLSYIILFSVLLAIGIIGSAWFVYHRRSKNRAK